MLSIPASILKQIWQHGGRSYPEEGAGLLLGGEDGGYRHVARLHPLPNRFESGLRHNRYRIDPKDMLEGERKAERLGLDVIGVFHSHPDHPASPSEFDRQWALPWYSYVITSVVHGKAIESRAWRLREDRTAFFEEKVEIVEIPISEETS